MVSAFCETSFFNFVSSFENNSSEKLQLNTASERFSITESVWLGANDREYTEESALHWTDEKLRFGAAAWIVLYITWRNHLYIEFEKKNLLYIQSLSELKHQRNLQAKIFLIHFQECIPGYCQKDLQKYKKRKI